MVAIILIVTLVVFNILLNFLTNGRLSSKGIDFIVPAVILAGQSGGAIWGLVTAGISVGGHFLSAQRGLHNAPIALASACITAIGVGLIPEVTLLSATKIGLFLYHTSSALIVYLLYRKIGIRYLFFVGVNSTFTLFILSVL